jgi:hypothetical protein
METAVATNLLDTTLVYSLAILAFSSIIFLIFMVPVLVQLCKVLEAANSLITTVRDYTRGITSGISSIGQNIFQVGSKLAGAFGMVETGIKEFLFGSKGRR